MMKQIQTGDNVMCLLLTAGKSERMHKHKASLGYSENENFLQHIISQYRKAGLKRIVVVKNPDIKTDDDYTGVTFIENNNPDFGRIYSIHLGLRNAVDVEYCFIQNIDNPFVDADLIKKIFDVRLKGDFISPVYKSKGGHPVLVSKNVIKSLRELTSFETTLKKVLEGFNRFNIEIPNENILVNINTNEDYENNFSNLKRKIAIRMRADKIIFRKAIRRGEVEKCMSGVL